MIVHGQLKFTGFRRWREMRKIGIVGGLGPEPTVEYYKIITGYLTGSMALLADGWHMASHAAALSITYIAYRLATSPSWAAHFNFGGGKIIPLGGYTSAILLVLVSFYMVIESIERLLSPVTIQFTQAIVVATAGLIVNLVSALILKDHHTHKDAHEHYHDHNIKGAYLHVLADALTSIAAIVALVLGRHFGVFWLDPLIGVVGALVIAKWSYTLIRDTGWELMDGHAKELDYDQIKKRIQGEHVEIIDLHVWKIAPGILSCELVVKASDPKGIEYYRRILRDEFSLSHIVVEERRQSAF